MRKSLRTPAHDQLVVLLRESRERAGLTQAQVAERLGKPQSFVAKFEGGERRLDLIEFITVTKALGVRPADLMREIEAMVVLSAAPPSRRSRRRASIQRPA